MDAFDFIRTIAVARIMMPTSYVRLSAGREQMSEQTQAMCFMAGANSIFYGCKLLTTPNPEEDKDVQLFRKLGLNPHQTEVQAGITSNSSSWSSRFLTPTPTSSTTRQPYDWQARIRTALDERRAADAFRVRRVVENGAGRFLPKESGSVISPATIIWA